MNHKTPVHYAPLLQRGMIWGFLLLGTALARAFWPADATTSFNAFNNAFYVSDGANAYYKLDTGTGTGIGWWTFAEQIEMVEDAYEHTPTKASKNMVNALCHGFITHHGTQWTANYFNDDVAWAIIAFARAYQITGNRAFRNCAKANFDAMFSRAWDDELGGGLWQTTGKSSKNAGVNGPAAMAAYLLYKIYGETNYLAKAQQIYNWERSKLFDAHTGQVYDSINASGEMQTQASTCNQGAFIGAANYLRQTNDAMLAANYTRHSLCLNDLLPEANENSDSGSFNGIFLRWMARFMKDCRLQSTYLPWLQRNANAAWNARRPADHLAWNNWRHSTPTTGPRYAAGCVNLPVALQVIPADGEGILFCEHANFEGTPSQLAGPGAFPLAQLEALGVANDSVSSLRIPPGWQVTLYQDEHFGGTNWTFTGDTASVGPAANDQMSSCKIQTTGVIFYQDRDYQGTRSQTLSKGTYTLAQLAALGVRNDWVSSLRMPPGWTVMLYEDDHYQGTHWEFNADTVFVGEAANDRMTSCKIW